jgi:hypothetical protein
MTGLTDTENVVKGFENGGVDYVTKPIVSDELLARIRVHLANSRLARSARMALDISGTPLTAVDAQGQLLWITPEASKLFGDSGGRAGGINELRWRERIASAIARVVKEKLAQSPLHEFPGGTLFASFVGESDAGEYLIRLSDGRVTSEDEILKNASI